MPSLYVHVPFCLKKCAYCAFYSMPLHGTAAESYLASLEKEIILRQGKLPQKVSTLFLGGGTPTCLSTEELNIFLSLLNKHFDFDKDAEKTIEANPGTLTVEKLQILHEQGINRISLGVQSFNDDLLRLIGRIHTSEEVRDAVHLIREADFKNLNLDLMFGLPGQNLEDWQKTLEESIRIRPEHISVYGLMVEEGTPLALSKKLIDKLPDDDVQAGMYDLARAILSEAGYHHYETSNYAVPGYECRHNLGYWQGEEYIGLGPGAVSYLKNRRWKNSEDLSLYIAKLKRGESPFDPEEDENLSEQEKRAERIILGLRLAKGLNLKGFREEFGVDLQKLYPVVLQHYLKNGVLQIDEEQFLKMNPDFWFVANTVLQEFV